MKSTYQLFPISNACRAARGRATSRPVLWPQRSDLTSHNETLCPLGLSPIGRGALGRSLVAGGILSMMVFPAYAEGLHPQSPSSDSDPYAWMSETVSCDRISSAVSSRFGAAPSVAGLSDNALLREEFRHIAAETCANARYSSCSFTWCALPGVARKGDANGATTGARDIARPLTIPPRTETARSIEFTENTGPAPSAEARQAAVKPLFTAEGSAPERSGVGQPAPAAELKGSGLAGSSKAALLAKAVVPSVPEAKAEATVRLGAPEELLPVSESSPKSSAQSGGKLAVAAATTAAAPAVATGALKLAAREGYVFGTPVSTELKPWRSPEAEKPVEPVRKEQRGRSIQPAPVPSFDLSSADGVYAKLVYDLKQQQSHMIAAVKKHEQETDATEWKKFAVAVYAPEPEAAPADAFGADAMQFPGDTGVAPSFGGRKLGAAAGGGRTLAPQGLAAGRGGLALPRPPGSSGIPSGVMVTPSGSVITETPTLVERPGMLRRRAK